MSPSPSQAAGSPRLARRLGSRVSGGAAALVAVAAVVTFVSFGISVLFDSKTNEAEAQIGVCVPGLPCPDLPGVINPGDLLNPVTDPIIGGLKDAAAGLLEGAWEKFAASIAEAAVSALNVLSDTVFGSWTPDLDVVGEAYSATSTIGGALYVVAFAGAIAFALPTLRAGELVEALKGVAYTAFFIVLLRPMVEFADIASSVLAQQLMRDANADIGLWLESAGVGLITAVTTISWVWVLLGSGLFLFGVIAQFFLFIGATWGVLVSYVAAPLLAPLMIPQQTRHLAFRLIRLMAGFHLMKVLVAVSHRTVASVLASSPPLADDALGAIVMFIFAGIGWIATGIGTPRLVLELVGADGLVVRVAERYRQAGRQIGEVPVKAVVTGAVIASGTGGPAVFTAFNRLRNQARVAQPRTTPPPPSTPPPSPPPPPAGSSPRSPASSSPRGTP